MFKLASMTQKQPRIRESRMTTSGYGLWIVWTEELTEAIPHTFLDYGGLPLMEDAHQSLWFFFTKDVFKALARLQVWAKLNDLPVFIEVFQASLKVGFQLERELSIATDINAQEALKPDEFQIWIHAGCKEAALSVPGIELTEARPYSGLAAGPWSHIEVDSRLGYESGLAWYGVLKPLGNPLDKNFAEGWRKFYGELEGVLERLKLSFLFKDNNIIFALNNYRTMRTWCLEVLTLMNDIKHREEDSPYWPSVMVVAEKDSLNFNEELPSKIHIDWEQMAPDFPHMSYRTAFMLGERFKIKDVSFSLERGRFTDWCYVHLADVEEEQGGSLPVAMPAALVAGSEHPCFYCGFRNHKEAECPSRAIRELNPGIWGKIARTGLEEINTHFAAVGQEVEKAPVPALLGQVEAKEGADLTKAIYEINATLQLRMVPNVFRSVGKEFPEALKNLAPPDTENYAYEILRELMDGDLLQAERMARDHAFKNPGDYMPRVLNGFINVEKGDLEKAEQIFKDAEPLGPAPFHHSYMFFLRGRALEIQYKFDSAIGMYKQAAMHSPKWKEPLYRQAVCMVKMGFTEHSLGIFSQLFQAEPSFFNRIIIDPELERGAIQILSYLWGPWTEAQAAAQDGMEKLAKFSLELEEWFGEESGDFGKQIKKSAENLREMGEVDNYVAFRRIVSGYARLSKEMRRQVDEEIKVLNKKAQIFSDQLKDIHDEISWFPFPKALKEFNNNFNYCASRVNWVKTQHFRVAENFRKSRVFFDEVEEKIKKLYSHLVTLRLVRDATLFMLLLGKTFMWYEIVGLGLSLALGPVIIYLAQSFGASWFQEALVDQRWALQKGLIIVLSVVALALAFIRTAMAFEKKKDKFFVKYKDKEPKRAAKRAKKMKARREKRMKKAQAARAKAMKKAKAK